MEKAPVSPTVFFYKRSITNAEEIENEMRWVYDFEYVPEDAKLDPDTENQYTKTSKAQVYQNDKDELDQYLRALTHVKYSDYKCFYEKGGAQITGHDLFV